MPAAPCPQSCCIPPWSADDPRIEMHADAMPRLVTYEVIGDLLALRWADGLEQYLPLRLLRDACPCAVCRGEPSLMEAARPPQKPPIPEAGYRLLVVEPVGAYALCPRWGDGHATGIYSFSFLRTLAGILDDC